MGYSKIQRTMYNMRRHVVGIVLMLVGVTLLALIGSALSVANSLDLVFGGFVRVGLGVSAILLVLKFAFPKLHIQESINDDAKAVAMFCAGIAIAIALLF